MSEDLKGWCQSHHVETLAQLAVFQPAREVLLEDRSVVAALEMVVESGITAEAREHAAAALLALSDKELHMVVDGQKHVMISYQV